MSLETVTGKQTFNKKAEEHKITNNVVYYLCVVLLQAVAGDKQMWFGHPEDVVDGSSRQDLPHCLVDDIRVLCGLHFHGSQETHDEELVQDGVCEGTFIWAIYDNDLFFCLKSLSVNLRSAFGTCTFTVSWLHLSRLPEWVCPSLSKGDKETSALF